MHTIRTYISNSGSTKHIHTILDEPHPHSYANYLLLFEQLREKDVDYLKEKNWYIRVQFNISFLKTRKNKEGLDN